MTLYRVFKNDKTGQHEIMETNSSLGFELVVAQKECAKLNSAPKFVASDHQNAIQGIPSIKSLKNYPAKIALNKRAEEIENGNEEIG
jgi:hypothetical protein